MSSSSGSIVTYEYVILLCRHLIIIIEFISTLQIGTLWAFSIHFVIEREVFIYLGIQ